jgi:hypothetical protein
MTEDDINQTLNLIQGTAGFFEAYHVTRFHGQRISASGESQSVLIEVTDSGTTGSHRIILVRAVDENDPKCVAFGNIGRNLREAFNNVHWEDLDRSST